jgi:hypothetical protein
MCPPGDKPEHEKRFVRLYPIFAKRIRIRSEPVGMEVCKLVKAGIPALFGSEITVESFRRTDHIRDRMGNVSW